jgi:hypothetical protein
VFSGRGLCDELIIFLEESYRLGCVVVYDLETSRMRSPWPTLGRSAKKKKIQKSIIAENFTDNLLCQIQITFLNRSEIYVQVFM